MARRRFEKWLAGLLCLLAVLLAAASAEETGEGLSWLAVRGGIFSPVFDGERNTYYAILENDIATYDDAGVEIRPCDEGASVSVICLDELGEGGALPEGKRVTFMISVAEPSGRVSRYYLKLYRKSAYTAPIDEAHRLASIEINGGAIEVPGFSGTKAYYEVTVPADVRELRIQAYPADRSKMARVINAPKVMTDEPVCVSILVRSEDGDESFSLYTLRLTRESFARTPSYTAPQMLCAVLTAFAAGAAVSLAACRRGRGKDATVGERQNDAANRGE